MTDCKEGDGKAAMGTKVYLTPLGKLSALGEVALRMRETGKGAAEVMADNEKEIKKAKDAVCTCGHHKSRHWCTGGACFDCQVVGNVCKQFKAGDCTTCRFGPRTKGELIDSCHKYAMADQCYDFGYTGYEAEDGTK